MHPDAWVVLVVFVACLSIWAARFFVMRGVPALDLMLLSAPREADGLTRRGVLVILGMVGLVLGTTVAGILVLRFLWTSPAIIATATADFEAVKADDAPGRFDAELGRLVTSLRGQRGYELRALRFEPHQIAPVCVPTTGTPRIGQCRADWPDRPLHTWPGEAVWQERRRGQAEWRDRSCTMTVSWTLARTWNFLGYRACQSMT